MSPTRPGLSRRDALLVGLPPSERTVGVGIEVALIVVLAGFPLTSAVHTEMGVASAHPPVNVWVIAASILTWYIIEAPPAHCITVASGRKTGERQTPARRVVSNTEHTWTRLNRLRTLANCPCRRPPIYPQSLTVGRSHWSPREWEVDRRRLSPSLLDENCRLQPVSKGNSVA